MKFAITKKIGMSRIFNKDGKHTPVTLLSLLSGKVVRHKLAEGRDGYNAVVVEVESEKKNKKSSFFEFRVENPKEYEIGKIVDLSDFNIDDIVTVEGEGKGKGFAGTIKRHGFSRGPVTHGSHNIRQPGSIGGGYPQRVVAGRKMPGRMGNQHVTTSNLKVIAVDPTEKVIAVSGSVPGATKKLVKIMAK